jgi:hypothetical protein
MTTGTQEPRQEPRARGTQYGGRGAQLPLSRRGRRVLLVLHLVSGGAWIGVDVMVAVLVATGWFADDVELRGLAYRALASFVVWPMLVCGLVCLATGLPARRTLIGRCAVAHRPGQARHATASSSRTWVVSPFDPPDRVVAVPNVVAVGVAGG